MKRYQWVFASLCFGTVLLGLQLSSGVGRFIQYAKQHAEGTAAVTSLRTNLALSASVKDGWSRQQLQDNRAKLREQIQAEAVKRRIAPVDAKLDRIWKAIPGYNGLEVDVEQSLLQNEQQMFPNPPKLVFREIPPKVTLDQLGSQPVYKGNPNKPMAALMINVAWGDEYIPGMLEVLRKHGVHATFFFDGSWLKKNIETARIIQKEGHELSNHAYSHKNMSQLSRSQATEEIAKTEALLQNELGVRNTLFAPPSGDFNQATVDIAYGMKLRTVLWTLDTVDWMKPEPSSVVRKIASRVEPGTLVLMHPTSSSSQALDGMIRAIKNKKLQLGTVSEVLSEKRVPQVESAGQ
ncbi:polysaccharide deacetylase family protein [Paenibacillus filicis]|uniref:Polysaccharide deacetylase family protein n=1 Tax=Paenibacillus gyeongsangnamensis TaxID=3388067 RepID=A0ABT4Q611_9BACL|nr:polysaccharide deacetylase family protein [Paenibacillus filicis]MCZ8512318.1 polysaccharide deacetylase family protein [Paenibacillus filicis]